MTRGESEEPHDLEESDECGKERCGDVGLWKILVEILSENALILHRSKIGNDQVQASILG